MIRDIQNPETPLAGCGLNTYTYSMKERWPVFFITPDQAIDVWIQLERAYRGEHSYGGHTAEVYCYMLEARVPGCDHEDESGDLDYEAYAKRARFTAMAFDWLFGKLEDAYPGVSIEVGGRGVGEWRSEQLPRGEAHRLHVTVRPGGVS